MSDTPMTISSAEKMHAAEGEAARLVDVWVGAYLAYPTAGNFDGLSAKLREYQTEWMNGRERPTTGGEAQTDKEIPLFGGVWTRDEEAQTDDGEVSKKADCR